jgi:hypothetical protein
METRASEPAARAAPGSSAVSGAPHVVHVRATWSLAWLTTAELVVRATGGVGAHRPHAFDADHSGRADAGACARNSPFKNLDLGSVPTRASGLRTLGHSAARSSHGALTALRVLPRSGAHRPATRLKGAFAYHVRMARIDLRPFARVGAQARLDQLQQRASASSGRFRTSEKWVARRVRAGQRFGKPRLWRRGVGSRCRQRGRKPSVKG